ncbi:MAG: uroporphyrinogen-III C-methyltransferase, partial [Candidatus Poribacteria bacterium]|nr:uroporphyrinogen-III C-methyltransferase [Candidatus Poribacteria bacterium]
GRVYLVGGGPGDPKLITLKGVECLQCADVVIYDLLISDALLDHCPPHCERIYGGKRPGEQRKRQDEINALMLRKAKEGKTVVRLKGGDPFIFGRGGEEVLTLVGAGIDFEIVPGITSAIAAPAYAGIPLTHRDHASSVAFVTGHSASFAPDSPIGWERLATAVDTLVVYMGIGHLDQIAAQLTQHGRSPDTPVTLVHWGTTPQQKTLEGTLTDISEKAKEANFRNPAVVVVGEVNRLREQLRWYDSKPLFGKRIVVTRARAQSSGFAELLESYGAHTIQFPTIEIQPILDKPDIDKAITCLSEYHWIIFTSVNAVEIFYSRLRENGADVRSFGKAQICAVGPKTIEALNGIGILPDFVPSQSRAVAIADEMQNLVGKNVLLPCAKIAPEDFPNGLREKGAVVHTIPIYNTVKTEGKGRKALEKKILDGEIDAVTFTSSSTVDNFVGMFDRHRPKDFLAEVRIAVIGPSTAEAAKRCGLKIDVMPSEASVEALAKEIVRYYAKNT